MTSGLKPEDEGRIVEQCAQRLGEYFDCVQIMCSRSDSTGTFVLKRGVGNWYARQGMAHEFINQDVAQENAEAIAEKLKTEDEE